MMLLSCSIEPENYSTVDRSLECVTEDYTDNLDATDKKTGYAAVAPDRFVLFMV